MAAKLKRLRELRVRAALSQQQLAEESGVSRYSIGKLENLDRGARPTTIQKLSKVLNVKPEELMDGKKE